MKPGVQDERQKVGTLLCFALDEEVAPLRKMAVEMADASILITGIGRKNAEGSLRRFLEKNRPKLVLSCGFAGGLNPALAVGDVVYMTGYPALEERLEGAGAKLATFSSAPRMAVTAAEKKKLRAETGADVVEMESGAILAVCRESEIPCAMVRAISDPADEDLPLDFNALSKPDMNLDRGKLFWAVMKSPNKIGALMQLHKKTRYAAGRLAAVLAEFMAG